MPGIKIYISDFLPALLTFQRCFLRSLKYHLVCSPALDIRDFVGYFLLIEVYISLISCLKNDKTVLFSSAEHAKEKEAKHHGASKDKGNA